MAVKKGNHSMTMDTISQISTHYKNITAAINRVFWDSSSDKEHSLYVGSYGRGTAINTSGLDVIFRLPNEEYEHFNSLYGNGQSRLLQAVKMAVLQSMPRTQVHGDGQVVVVEYSDGIRFEIVPAFDNTIYGIPDGTFKYPDTHMGGKWRTTNPRAEQDAMKCKNSYGETNGLLIDTCKHIRYIRDAFFSSYHLSGILIDSFVYQYIGSWCFLRPGEKEYSNGTTFEQYLLSKYEECLYIDGIYYPTINAPGSGMPVDTSKDWVCLGKVLKKMVES